LCVRTPVGLGGAGLLLVTDETDADEADDLIDGADEVVNENNANQRESL
jgi:hypothetical protein